MSPRRQGARKLRIREDLFMAFPVAPGVEIDQEGLPFVALERQVRLELQRLDLPPNARVVRELAQKIIPEVVAQARRGKVNLRRIDLRRHYEEILSAS